MGKMGKEKKSTFSKILTILKWVVIGFISFIFIGVLLILLIRGIGKAINNKTPDGGINESMHVNINNSTQWISIYGKDKSNPVILYLHGGPGSSTSYMDYKFLRKWSDIYTVVSWDQRDVGLSANDDKDQKSIPYTKELFMTDGIEMTKYLLKYLKKEKLVLIGHSWGSIFGANLVLEHPEYYEYFIGTGQVIDWEENEKGLKEAAMGWSKGDKEGEELVAQLDLNKPSVEYITVRGKVLQKYGLTEKPDYSITSAIFFNPYYSISDVFKAIKVFTSVLDEQIKYMDFLLSPEFDKFSLLNRTEYQVPYYNINGDQDYQANTHQSEAYYNVVKAPRKMLYIMKNMSHGLLTVRSEEFSDYMHIIAESEKTGNSTMTNTN